MASKTIKVSEPKFIVTTVLEVKVCIVCAIGVDSRELETIFILFEMKTHFCVAPSFLLLCMLA